MYFFSNIFCLHGFFFCSPPPPHHFSNGPSLTLNRSRTESTFCNKSNKLLFLSTQLRHTLLDKQLSRFNKFLHALVFVDRLNSFRRLLGSVISFPHSVQTVSLEDKEISILENVSVSFVDQLSAR